MEPLWKSKGEGTVVRLNTPDDVEALLQLLEQIADEESWQPGSQLRAYLDASHHFAVQVKGQLVGGLQVVLSDTPGCLPYQRV